jgi:hypothetical protein
LRRSAHTVPPQL